MFLQFCDLFYPGELNHFKLEKGRLPTLDSKINLAPGIAIAPTFSKFSHHNIITFSHQSRHCGHFLTFFLQNFSRIDKRSPMFIPESRVQEPRILIECVA